MDLFDVVRAAPPPTNVRELKNPAASAETDEEKQDAGAGTETETAEKVVDKSKTKSSSHSPPPAEVSEVFNIESESEEDVLAGTAFALRMSPDEGKSQEAPIFLDSDDNEDDKNSADSQGQPPKTKAEQKMFSQQPRRSKHHKDSSSSSNQKNCMVQIKRLTQSEIDRLTKSMTPKRHTPGKRGRARLSETPSSSTPKHKPSSSDNKAYIKISKLENGAKKRMQSPPPAKLKKSPKATASTPMKLLSTKSLIKHFGKRFFECVVRMKRFKMPEKVARSSQKSKSVSFSEAVEILGSKPRKSSSIVCSTPRIKSKSKLNSSVPTRLQRVDATGNVVEDIELNSSLVLDSSTPTSSSRKSKSGRSSSSCNGGRRAGKLKRPALRVPTTDLASLRIDDSHEEETEANEEYIVPNEVPDYHTAMGVRRAGTPNPLKRVTVTTTVSDDEGGGDAPDTKKSKRQVEQAKSPAKETESAVQKVQEKPVDAENQQQVETPLEQKIKEEAEESEQIMTESEQTEAEAKAESKQMDPESKMTKQTEFEIKEAEEKEFKPEAGVFQSGDEPPEVESRSYYLNDSDATPDEVDSTATTPSPTPAAKNVSMAGEDAMEDDILEIQTSLDDVRELHTPTSPLPRLQIDEQRDDSRSERCGSLDSDTSYKSANHLVINTAAEPLPEESSTEAEPEQEEEHETPTHTASTSPTASTLTSIQPIQPRRSTASVVTTEAASNTTTQNTFNTSEAASGSGIGQTMYSPIAAMPTLNDEDLDDLVDFFN